MRERCPGWGAANSSAEGVERPVTLGERCSPAKPFPLGVTESGAAEEVFHSSPQTSGKGRETPACGAASLLTGKPSLHGPPSANTRAGLQHGAVSRATSHQEEEAVGVESLLCPREKVSDTLASSALLVGEHDRHLQT